MDTNQTADEAMLVNFRAPKSVIETLDQLSRFHHRTRTSILLDLINSWINERTYDVPLKVRQLKDLKSALNSHDQSAPEIAGRLAQSQSKYRLETVLNESHCYFLHHKRIDERNSRNYITRYHGSVLNFTSDQVKSAKRML